MRLTVNFKNQTIESKNVPIKEMITIVDGVTVVIDEEITKKSIFFDNSIDLQNAIDRTKVEEFVDEFISSIRTIAVYSCHYKEDGSDYVPSYILAVSNWILNKIKSRNLDITVNHVLNKEQKIASFILIKTKDNLIKLGEPIEYRRVSYSEARDFLTEFKHKKKNIDVLNIPYKSYDFKKYTEKVLAICEFLKDLSKTLNIKIKVTYIHDVQLKIYTIIVRKKNETI